SPVGASTPAARTRRGSPRSRTEACEERVVRAAVERRRPGAMSRDALHVLDRLEPERAGEPVRRPRQRLVEAAADARLRGEALDLQDAARAIRLQVGASDEAVADEQRQDVVAVRALVLALVDLDQVVEAEEPTKERAVP